MILSPAPFPVEFPGPGEDILQPERADQGLGVGDHAVAAGVQHLLRRRRENLQEFAGIVPGRQLLDILTRIKPPDPPVEPAAPEGASS